MHPIVSEHVARAREEDLQREAARARRIGVARARAPRPSARPATQRVRVALGRRLVDVGTRLAGTGPGAPAGSGVPCP